eukprot:TRINITY_DN6123_c0_g1_i1.p1 TRINITY_DN6123_c0_g1~~TRINITY_DN6123_c0_g1_i1.p1  ORF type:complete len:471 (+),score=144.58 TRINITY_DN6123_c0_g1_i1:35-1414(+)
MKCCGILRAAHKVAVVGGGPSGWYTAQTVLKGLPDCEVDIYDKMVVPFGLARYGVAPDHPEVKNVGIGFTEMIEGSMADRVRFYGNVEVGQDVTMKDLLEHYHQVVVATGADSDKTIGIPGEDKYVTSARSLVAWYNGLPGASPPVRPLSGIRNVVIVGNGNVAVDCARILLAPLSLLENTDITSEALQGLATSAVRSVSLVARRGIINTAFTIKEFREMLSLGQTGPKGSPNTHLSTHIHDGNLTIDEESLDRKYKRLISLIMQTARENQEQQERSFHVRYLRRPVEATEEGLVVSVMKVKGPELEGKVEDTGVTELVPADMILRSIGYKSVLGDETIPFDTRRGVIPADAGGRILKGDAPLPRAYCSGWVKNGPVGVILAAHVDGKTVGGTMVSDAAAAQSDASCSGQGSAAILPRLKNPRTWSTWQAIREAERIRGEKLNKVAEKITSVEEMLSFA